MTEERQVRKLLATFSGLPCSLIAERASPFADWCYWTEMGEPVTRDRKQDAVGVSAYVSQSGLRFRSTDPARPD